MVRSALPKYQTTRGMRGSTTLFNAMRLRAGGVSGLSQRRQLFSGVVIVIRTAPPLAGRQAAAAGQRDCDPCRHRATTILARCVQKAFGLAITSSAEAGRG